MPLRSAPRWLQASGCLPVLAVRVDEQKSVALSSALAAGFMLGASAGLFYEGALNSPPNTVFGALLGIGFIWATRAFLGHRREAHIGTLRGARGITALMVIGVMTVHSLAEGIAIGVSLAGDESLGVLIAIAIAIHNIPEGVTVSLAMVPFGESARSAAAWSIFSSLPQPLIGRARISRRADIRATSSRRSRFRSGSDGLDGLHPAASGVTGSGVASSRRPCAAWLCGFDDHH